MIVPCIGSCSQQSSQRGSSVFISDFSKIKASLNLGDFPVIVAKVIIVGVVVVMIIVKIIII